MTDRFPSHSLLIVLLFLWSRAFTASEIVASEIVAGESEVPKRPNLLFIFLDDFGWRDCEFMGSDFYETPHIDSLATRGMAFLDAYAAAANCAPSRASLLSGQYTPRHRIFNVGTRRRGNPSFGKLKHIRGTNTLAPEIRTWADQLRATGYRTGTIGKWHLSDDPRDHGFDFNFAGTHRGGPSGGYFPPHPGVDDLKNAPPQEYLTDRLTSEAIGFIDRNHQQPWCLYLTHFAVHTPLQGKANLVKKYNLKPSGALHDHAVMAAMIESVDDGIGRILGHLDQLALTDNTVIVFSSDNGGYGPATDMAPLKGYKGTYYEGGIRVPLIVVWPGVTKPGSVSKVPVINVDVFPTFCAISGAQLPTNQPLDGQSLVPLLRGGVDFAPRAIYWHFPAYLQSYQRIDSQRDPLYRSRPCGIIRRGKWKLHEYFETGDLELYDLEKDIGEQINLVAEYPDRANQLHAQLKQWRQSTDAPVPTELNPKYDAAAEAAAIAAMNAD